MAFAERDTCITQPGTDRLRHSLFIRYYIIIQWQCVIHIKFVSIDGFVQINVIAVVY